MQEKIDQQSIATAPWYRKNDPTAEMIPVPLLGPDLYDMRQIDLIKSEAAKAKQKQNHKLKRQSNIPRNVNERNDP